MFIVVIVLVVYFGVANSAFFSSANLANVANFTSATAIVAVGEVFLLICGEIDLSAGMTFALSPFVVMAAVDVGVPPIVAVVLGLLASAAVGLFNGVVTQLLRLPSFITTLGTLFLLHGITLKVSNNFPRPAPQDGALWHVLGAGRPEDVVRVPGPHTAEFLAPLLGRRPQAKPKKGERRSKERVQSA